MPEHAAASAVTARRGGFEVCGIFAWTGPAAPDPQLLAAAAAGAFRRGPDALGLVGFGAAGGARRVTHLGRPTLAVLERLVAQLAEDDGDLGPVQVLVGHARLATSGTWRDARNVQPVVRGAGALAHNGNVRGWRELARHHRIHLHTGVDSEVIAALASRRGIEAAHQLTDAHRPVILVWATAAGLQVLRRGHPLRAAYDPTGCYLSNALPSGRLLREGTWHTWRTVAAGAGSVPACACCAAGCGG